MQPRPLYRSLGSFARVVVLVVLISLLSAGLAGAATTLTIVANAYTPEITTGDNPQPLHEFTRIAREWEAMHPGVKVKFLKMPTGDYHTWILTQLKGNMAPDIVWVHDYWVKDDAKYGYFLPLDDLLNAPNKYLPGNSRWRDLFFQDALESKRASDDKLYSLPIDRVGAGFFYNKKIFKEVGAEVPTTWAEWLDACEKIKKAGYIPFLCQGGTFGGTITLIAASFHDQLWNEAVPQISVKGGGTKGYIRVDAQEFVRAYKKGLWSVRDPRHTEIYRLIKESSKYWNEDALASGGTDRLFRIGKAAMYMDGSWFAPALQRDKLRTFEFGVFLMPQLTKEVTPYATGAPPRDLGGPYSVQYAITSDAKRAGKAELAADFLQFITIPRNLQPMIAECGMFLPNSPGMKGSPVLEPFIPKTRQGEIRFSGEPPMPEYDQEHYRTIQSYIGGEYSEEQFLSLLEGFLSKAIDREIANNPQWRFTKDWDILPDGSAEKKDVRRPPAVVRSLPWSLPAVLLALVVFSVARNWRNTVRQIRQKKAIYLFVVPTMFLIVTFCYYPIISAFYHAFFDWKGGGESAWVGMANFRELFQDRLLGEATIRMLKLMLFGMIISITVPFAAAELIFHLKSVRAQYIYRVLFVIPMVVPGIVMLLIWGFIFEYNIGVINQLMRAVGLGAYVQSWLGDPKIALYSLMLVGFPWIGGFSLLIYFAGLQAIPVDVLDSCKLDGATGWSRIKNVDIPLVMAQTKLLLILGFIGGLQGFQTQLILTAGGPGYSTTVPGLHLYQNAMTYDRMGYACAIGVVLFIVILGLTYLNTKYLKSNMET